MGKTLISQINHHYYHKYFKRVPKKRKPKKYIKTDDIDVDREVMEFELIEGDRKRIIKA